MDSWFCQSLSFFAKPQSRRQTKAQMDGLSPKTWQYAFLTSRHLVFPGKLSTNG